MSAVELANTSLINDSNLQGYWKLENVNDSGPNGYNLTNNGSATFASGKFNNGVSLTRSSSQYLSIADGSCPNLEISGSKTYSCWVKPTVLTDFNFIMGKFVGGTGGARIYYGASGIVNVDFGLSKSMVSDSGLSTGTTYFIAVVHDASAQTLTLWVDDTKKQETSVTGSTTDSNTAFTIGAQADPTHYLDGVIDDVAVFDKALTDLEIDELYDGPKRASFLFSFI